MRIGVLDRWRRLPRSQRGHPRRRAQGRDGVRPRVRRASATAGEGPLEGVTHAARRRRRCAASCPAAARSSARRAPTRSRSTAASSGSRRTSTTLGVDALIAIGGEDTLGVATKLHEHGVHVVGVPKTIDNDLNATDYTFGFDTAVNIAMEAIDRLHTTAESHHRALDRRGDGPARGLDRAARRHRRRRQRHPHPRGAVRHRARSAAGSSTASRRHYAPIIVVAEGATPGRGRRSMPSDGELDAFGHVRLGGIGDGAGEGDREAHRQGGPHHGARPHPARRHADRVRPLAGHPVRAARDRRRPRRRLGQDGRAARHRHRAGPAGRRDDRAQDSSPPQLYDEAEVFFG